MARHLFAGTAEYMIVPGVDNVATLAAGVTVTAWNASTGGTQLTDLTLIDGVTPILNGELTSDANGSLPEFRGPDGVTWLYLDGNGGSGPRERAVALDLGDDVGVLRSDLNAHTGAANPHGTTLQDLGGVYDPNITALTATSPFYIAHRGSGGEFPEHTLRAYESALAAGALAVEVSVQLTADGVLVAFHDTTLDRVTDHTGPLVAWSLAALREQVNVDVGASLLGAGWSSQPIPTLEEVLASLYGRCVIFLEAKSNEAIVPLRDFMLERYPGCQRSVVWKAHYGQGGLADRAAEGWAVWAYMDAGTTDVQLDAVDASVDLWGVPVGMTDVRIGEVVARGKVVIAWEVHRHSEVTRLSGLGVEGMMSSQWIYLNNGPFLAADLFAAQVSVPGTLGLANYDPDFALKYDGAGGASINRVASESVLMGGHRVPDGTAHTITFRMKWDTVPSPSLHSGMAFCKASDDKYQFGTANVSGGYHLVMRGNGDMQLYSHAPAVAPGTQLANIPTAQPVNGTYMDFEVVVTPTTIRINRTDGATWTTGDIANATYRGRYWHLSVGSVNSLTLKPFWREISVA